jgi:hypothetical protein
MRPKPQVRLQVVPPPATALSVAKGIVKNDGFKGLYAGRGQPRAGLLSTIITLNTPQSTPY